MYWVLPRILKKRPLKYNGFFNICNLNQKTLAMITTSMWQYIPSYSLIFWPYQCTFLHKNCIVTAYLNPPDKIYKIAKYKSNTQDSQNLSPKAIKKLQNYKSASKIVKCMSNIQKSQNSKPEAIRKLQNNFWF